MLEYVQQMRTACQEKLLYYKSKQSYMKRSWLKPTYKWRWYEFMPVTNDIWYYTHVFLRGGWEPMLLGWWMPVSCKGWFNLQVWYGD